MTRRGSERVRPTRAEPERGEAEGRFRRSEGEGRRREGEGRLRRGGRPTVGRPVEGRGRFERGEGRGRGAAEEPERLQKMLARAGLASRREAEEWIRAGRITVNSQIATLGVRVGPSDQVRLDGRLIRQRPAGGAARAFICHRSPGEDLRRPSGGDAMGEAEGDHAPTVARAAPGAADAPWGDVDDEHGVVDGLPDGAEHADRGGADSGGRRGVGSAHARGESHSHGVPSRHSTHTAMVERLPRRAGRRFISVSPMPRIDGGLELVTSDGELAAKLQRHVRALVSEFSVRVRGELNEQQLEGVLEGVLDSGERVAVERCEPSGGEGTNRWYSFAARGASGKDVRQLFERQGTLVSRVLRTHLGPVALERTLGRGHFRELTAEELDSLMAAADDSITDPDA